MPSPACWGVPQSPGTAHKWAGCAFGNRTLYGFAAKRKLHLSLTAKGKIKNRRAVHMAKNKKAPENAPLKDALPGKFYLSFCSCDFLFVCSFFS